MNSEQTLGLWRQGKQAWQSWAETIAGKRNELEKAGQWSVDWYGEGQNEATKAWLEEASADFCDATFEEGADFSGVLFPGPADFDGARFAAAVSFSGAHFNGNLTAQRAEFCVANFASTRFQGFAHFDRARFGADVTFEKAQFLKESDMEPCARFQRAQFSANADFTAAQFAGAIQFGKASFGATTFDKCEFKGDALFVAAQFGAASTFVKSRFSGARVDFGKAQFRGDARFLETHFGGSRAGLVFSGACCVNFGGVCFEQEASFRKSWLVGESDFNDAQFKGLTKFDGALFVMPASFANVEFAASLSMRDAQFVHDTDFGAARFVEGCDFAGAKFTLGARFQDARFAGPANFAGAEFSGPASFRGAVAEAQFTIDGARYISEPDFSDMKTTDPLDIGKLIKFKPKRSWFGWFKQRRRSETSSISRWAKTAPSDGDMESRILPPPDPDEADVVDAPIIPPETRTTSAAAKLTAEHEPATANNGDHSVPPPSSTDEQAYALEETTLPAATGEDEAVTSTDARDDQPPATSIPALGLAATNADAPARSELRPRRRSLLRPAAVWFFSIVLFVPLYLSQRPAGHADGEPWQRKAHETIQWEDAPGWFNASAGSVRDGLAWLSGRVAGALTTGACVTGHSDARGEALFLSAKNALVFVPWENEHVIHRTYGCLYGVDGAAPNIPLMVSLLSLIQALLSAVLLALILMALRDRVKRR